MGLIFFLFLFLLTINFTLDKASGEGINYGRSFRERNLTNNVDLSRGVGDDLIITKPNIINTPDPSNGFPNEDLGDGDDFESGLPPLPKQETEPNSVINREPDLESELLDPKRPPEPEEEEEEEEQVPEKPRQKNSYPPNYHMDQSFPHQEFPRPSSMIHMANAIDPKRGKVILGLRRKKDIVAFSGVIRTHGNVPWSKRMDFKVYAGKPDLAITQIRIINMDMANPAASIHISEGGVGMEWVNLVFNSARSKGFRYLVDVYTTSLSTDYPNHRYLADEYTTPFPTDYQNHRSITRLTRGNRRRRKY